MSQYSEMCIFVGCMCQTSGVVYDLRCGWY